MIGYLVLFLIFIVCVILECRYPLYRSILSICFSCFLVFFIGLRFDVGVDYFSYKEIFIEKYELAEIGYNCLSKIVHLIKGDFWLLTMFISVLIIICLHKVFIHFRYFFFSFFIYIIISDGYSFAINGSRQAVAAAFFLLAIKNLFNKKAYFLLCGIASCFHLSAIMLFPFYWLANKNYPAKRCFYFSLVIFISSFFFSFSGLFIPLFDNTYYSQYVELLDNFRNIEKGSSGLGFLLINLLGLTVLYKAKAILNKYPEVRAFIWAYFLFIILRNMLKDMPVFIRFTNYFALSMCIVVPYYVSVLYKGLNKILIVIVISISLSILFVKSVSNDTFKLKYKSILFNSIE